MSTAERKMELVLTTPRRAIWQDVANGVLKGFMTFLRRLGNRASANKLLEMDDHQLADIGLLRIDLERALNTGLDQDPTTHLSLAAQKRSVTRFARLRA